MTLVKLYLTVNFAVPLKLLHNCTTVDSFSALQQLTVKTSEQDSVCTIRALERHTVRKLYRSAKTVSARTKLLPTQQDICKKCFLWGSNPPLKKEGGYCGIFSMFFRTAFYTTFSNQTFARTVCTFFSLCAYTILAVHELHGRSYCHFYC